MNFKGKILGAYVIAASGCRVHLLLLAYFIFITTVLDTTLIFLSSGLIPIMWIFMCPSSPRYIFWPDCTGNVSS